MNLLSHLQYCAVQAWMSFLTLRWPALLMMHLCLPHFRPLLTHLAGMAPGLLMVSA